EELVSLTETWTFSAAGMGTFVIDDQGDPCDLTIHEIVASPKVFDSVERYVRLARALKMALGKGGELDGGT
ncbi:MAG: hypothetical protein JKY56_09080, partial [Kofleriaceae bacterium]|nr:hypothetical protein [Kofleriaceae bacterium]